MGSDFALRNKRRRPADDDRVPAEAPSLRRRSAGPTGVPTIQAKLEVGPVDDPYEREADAVADAVMHQFAQRRSGPAAMAGVGDASTRITRSAGTGRHIPADEHSTATVARVPISRIARSSAAGREGGALDQSTESRIRRSSGSGRALDSQMRGEFESAMGADLGSVRIHADSELAPEIGAQAFTLGNDVHFAPGTYDPGSASGQHLIAHELTHVVQQTGTAQRVQAKLWGEKEFKARTDVRDRFFGLGPSDASTAQDVILALLAEYHAASKKNQLSAPAKIAKIKAMKDVAERWLKTRGQAFEDPTNTSLATLEQARKTYEAAVPGPQLELGKPKSPIVKQKGAAAAANPKEQRINGLREFVAMCDGEMDQIGRDHMLPESRRRLIGLDDSSSQYQKAVERYPDEPNPTSVFAKVGELAEMVVGRPGSSAELSVTAEIPVQAGVFVTLGLAGAVERGTDNLVKLRVDVEVGVKGEIPGAAELKASLGGFLEAQAFSGAEAAMLMSYALYRRGREGSAPTTLVNLLWGGRADEAGMAKSEAWSRELEKKIFGDESHQDVETPEQSTDREKRNKARADGNVYVETGVTGKLGAGIGVGGAVEGELSGGAFTGRRVDASSLLERKGGAGAQNVKSSSVLNAGERQKRVGQTTVGWNVGGSVSAGGFSAGLQVSRTGRQTGGGAAGGEHKIDWAPIELEASGSGPMPPAAALGTKIYELAVKMVQKAKDAAKKQGDDDAGAQAALDTMLKGVAKQGLFNPKMELPVNTTLNVAVKVASDKSWEVGIGTEKANELELPAVLKVSLTRSQLFLQVGSEGTWYLGAE